MILPHLIITQSLFSPGTLAAGLLKYSFCHIFLYGCNQFLYGINLTTGQSESIQKHAVFIGRPCLMFTGSSCYSRIFGTYFTPVQFFSLKICFFQRCRLQIRTVAAHFIRCRQNPLVHLAFMKAVNHLRHVYAKLFAVPMSGIHRHAEQMVRPQLYQFFIFHNIVLLSVLLLRSSCF